MHIDLPTRSDIERLAAARESCCVSVYLPTSTAPVDSESNQLRARTLFKTAVGLVRERADAETAAAIEGQLNDLLEDTSFWFELGRSLALLVTGKQLVEFRLPNQVSEHVAVGERFAIIPILRSITFPHSALVLALSQHDFRLVQVSADTPAQEIPLPNAPHDAASAVNLDSIAGRSQFGRLQGDEGRKVRLTQYARSVDHALRPLLNGKSLPLILAATEPLESIYRNLSGYAHVAADTIRGNPEDLSEAQLADAARKIMIFMPRNFHRCMRCSLTADPKDALPLISAIWPERQPLGRSPRSLLTWKLRSLAASTTTAPSPSMRALTVTCLRRLPGRQSSPEHASWLCGKPICQRAFRQPAFCVTRYKYVPKRA